MRDSQDDSMFHYNYNELKQLLAEIIRENVSPEIFSWLNDKVSTASTINQFNTIFATLPRRTGKQGISIPEDLSRKLHIIRAGLQLKGWTIDRLARVWLILHADASDREKYFKTIENLFLGAEVNELVALYSALPVFAYPEMWSARCAEGIRNNIGDVLKVTMCNNPYPSENLDEQAWNQMVLKAFFTDKPVEEIIGLDQRSNEKLAKTLSDYAHERWSAHRTVNPQLWRCVGPFLNDELLPDIEKVSRSQNPLDKQAAALACYHSTSSKAKQLIPVDLLKAIEEGNLTWDKLAEKSNEYVLQ